MELITPNPLPLHGEHEARGARMGAFGSWLVPLYYTGIIEEHDWVRNQVGIFDICHMGEFFVRGARALEQVNQWIVNDARKLVDGQALYSPACHPNGGIVDDIVVLRMNSKEFYLVVNAGNKDKDFDWFNSHRMNDVTLLDVTAQTGLLAVQGPKSPDVVRAVFGNVIDMLSYYHFTRFNSEFGDTIISQTGYTGETGYEIFCPMENVRKLWNALFEKSKPFNLKPIGFGARDTLRLEARMPLYGHDLTDETSPLEAGLNWTIGWDKTDFIGKAALEKQKAEGVRRKLVGFEMTTRAAARQGCAIVSNGKEIGHVTSGSFSPTLKKSIGLGYVASEFAKIGQTLDISIRSRFEKAQIVKTPFYKRQKETM